ncbi:hypothetical protein OPW07_25505 [Vibrio europaeus]|uniref:hypothetical protein n=1 Tax=Vibrio europaeus TaxID=300876 RepID=UPI0018A76F21|nr:hypothetical protein [Vibrio europaeus]MDC5813077.1 hypothetical protein [Vibrio europaeus]QPG34145.1 hypothetical protein IXK98_08540 [Vibrio europaeus]
MRRYSSLLCTVLISTGVHADAFQQAMIDYGSKLEECTTIAKTNTDEFPVTDWFSELDVQSKKNVVLYLSLDNSTRCSFKEKAVLIETAETAPEPAKEALRFLLKEKPYREYIKNLDKDELLRIQREYSKPFDSLKVGKSLDLFE